MKRRGQGAKPQKAGFLGTPKSGRGPGKDQGKKTTPAPQRWVGGENGAGFRFGIIVSQFNRAVTDRLLKGATGALVEQGARRQDIEIAEVPGAFEIPGVAKRMGRLGRFDALICLGAVIQGETPHFYYICAEVSRGVGQLSLELGLPVIFGLLTTHTMDQALVRSGDEMNKGKEAAMAAIQMAHLYRDLK